MRNIAIQLSFDGTPYQGWQTQPHGHAIQDHLETALKKILEEEVRVIGCSRTDAGVHALHYVANFQCQHDMPTAGIRSTLQAQLGPSIAVHDAVEVHPDFDARRMGREKTYRYCIYQAPHPHPLLEQRAWHWRGDIDLAAMHNAAAFFEGEHNFTSFAAGNDEQPNKVRTIYRSALRQCPASEYWPAYAPLPGTMLIYEITGQAFLKHMVRNIAGTLLEVGRNHRPADSIPSILAAQDRTQAGRCAPAHGLYLVRTVYDPEIFGDNGAR